MSLVLGDSRRLLLAQCAIAALAVGAFAIIAGAAAGNAALFGGLAAVMHAWMLQRRVLLAQRVARVSPGGETTALYVGAVQRFVTMLALFVVGLGWLELSPVPLLATFAVVQVGYLVVGGAAQLRGPPRAGRQAENT